MVTSCEYCRGRPLRGVLFWRWDLQVYADMAPADYGVQVGDTTMDIIRDNAAQVKQLAAQQPPNPACKVGCWVPETQKTTFSTVNRSAPAPSHVSCLLERENAAAEVQGFHCCFSCKIPLVLFSAGL